MPFKISYHLPHEKEVVAEVIGVIPSNWCWIDGVLSAGRDLYEQSRIAENTRLVLRRFHDIKPTIIPLNDCPYEEPETVKKEIARKEDKPKTPKFSDVFLNGKLASSVLFDEAGFECDTLPFSVAKELAQGFVLHGYKGWLWAYSDYKNNHKFDNPERFKISHDEESIELDWNEKYGGKREKLDVFIEKFKELKIHEMP